MCYQRDTNSNSLETCEKDQNKTKTDTQESQLSTGLI